VLTSELIEHLCVLADKLGFAVRMERLSGGGGVCLLAGKKYLFVDIGLSPDEQIERMAAALAAEPGVAEAELHPEVRTVLNEFGAGLGPGGAGN
jgi:hypothetical protein